MPWAVRALATVVTGVTMSVTGSLRLTDARAFFQLLLALCLPTLLGRCIGIVGRIKQIVRIVRDHEHEGSQIWLDGMHGQRQFLSTQCAVVLEVAAIDDAVDDNMIAIADGAGR